MTITELIKELEKMPQDTEVCVRNGWKNFVTVESVVLIDQCKTPWVAIDGE